MVYGVLNEMAQFINSKEFFENPYQQSIPLQIEEVKPEINQEVTRLSTADYLVAFSTQNHSYCIGCVDMVESTKISARLPPKKLTSYYEIFLNSMSKIIGKFGGRVIKNVGDCLLYYFPESKDSEHIQGLRNCLDCGLVMIQAQKRICEELTEKDLPCLHYRVSADYGSVLVMNTSDSQKVDLIGTPVNMCAKINRCAGKDEFVIGSDLLLVAKKIPKYKFKQVKGYNVGFTTTYPVYKVTS